jgi:hypothetical protein
MAAETFNVTAHVSDPTSRSGREVCNAADGSCRRSRLERCAHACHGAFALEGAPALP